jgi:hypothetical protein
MQQNPLVEPVPDAIAFDRVADWLKTHTEDEMVIVAHSNHCDLPTHTGIPNDQARQNWYACSVYGS